MCGTCCGNNRFFCKHANETACAASDYNPNPNPRAPRPPNLLNTANLKDLDENQARPQFFKVFAGAPGAPEINSIKLGPTTPRSAQTQTRNFLF